MMSIVVVACLSLFANLIVNSIEIPFIKNVTLIPRYNWNSTMMTNQTLDNCICFSLESFVAFNWFPNKTCELFVTYSKTYQIRSTENIRLYFPQGIFPNKSECCMRDINYLLTKLRNGTWTYVNTTLNRNLLTDDNAYIVSIESDPPYLVRFHSQNLTLVSRNSIGTSPESVQIIGYFNGVYFAGFNNGPIRMIDSQNLTILANLFSSAITSIRGIMFLNNGRTLVASMFNSNLTCFFERISNGSLFDYTYSYQQKVNVSMIHGLTAVNDNYFYGTSYKDNLIYSFENTNESRIWIEKLIVNASSTTASSSNGLFVTIDDCGRFWFPLAASIFIFDENGTLIGNLTSPNSIMIDVLILDNYVLVISDRKNIQKQIIRIDPHLQC